MTTKARFAATLIRSAITLAASLTGPACAHAARFTVTDDKAAEEIGETTRLYIDGRLVADFRLDGIVTHKQIEVSVPDLAGTAAHQYALCGDIAYRTADGARLVRQVSGQGRLPAPDGHSFVAVGANDFTLFFLVDPSDRMASDPDPHPSPFCQAPIS